MSRKTSQKARELHRYLGFFLAGIMAVYAISGIVLIFRDTDLLKKEIITENVIETNLAGDQIGKNLKIKNFKIDREENGIVYFKNGSYEIATGKATIIKKKLPYVLDKMAHLHKAKSGEPLFFLNIFFGLALLFFVLSAFWMFMPGTQIFRKGVIYAAAGMALTLVLLFV
ncbi:PepSY-associated transmembrane protein [Nonlabens dokdonensis]|jgi:hypothetical protein|uniref:Membrane protein n=2 Tax=Nonlabens dokdonensis TaxID=328515 RepID=L7WD79_NONDD|nr:membrane protein [Nonlabens dokdonensis]AGC78054.1 membrane protein [Nonlabens dokdonensis DSW-6]PZX37119.1 PepSY-associated transmembrane protein [Nonlabens dokdonensis]